MGLFARKNNEYSNHSADSRSSYPDPAKLIKRMGNFSIDNPESLRTFNRTLASEQRWSSQFTGRAIEEYKRFMILAAISDKEVTPSEIVDQVWHKHLQYSSNYREELCGRVLGKVIDHNPGDGRSSESRYIAQYVDTTDFQ